MLRDRRPMNLLASVLALLVLGSSGAAHATAPAYGVKTDSPVYITTRDGTQLRATIYRPDASGHFSSTVPTDRARASTPTRR